MSPKPTKKHVRLDSRSVILLRETGCERAFAMVSAGTNLEALETAIARDDGFGDDLPMQFGEGAKNFGLQFENIVLSKDAEKLRTALGPLFSEDPFFRSLSKDFTFNVKAFPRGAEGANDNIGNANVWRQTSEKIADRFINHTEGSMILQGVLKIPDSARDWYLVPDVLVSPPNYPYYLPFELKSYERMAHIVEDHHIASASVQSCLYLHALMHGPYPEAAAPRTDMRTGIVFRANGFADPDPMLVAAERDLVAIEQILGRVTPAKDAFQDRFGQSYDSVAAGDLDAIEHITSTLSDACVHACRMAARCRDIARTQGLLLGYGDALARAYPQYGTVGAVRNAIENASMDTEDPNLARLLAVESEIDRLLTGVKS